MDQSAYVRVDESDLGVVVGYTLFVYRKPEGGVINFTVSHQSNAKLTKTMKVIVKKKVLRIEYDIPEEGFNGELYNGGVAMKLPEIIYEPEDADFDASKLSYSIEA